VQLSDMQGLQRVDTGESASWERTSAHTSSIVSPTPSQQSVHSQERADSTGFQRPAPFQHTSSMESHDWPAVSQSPGGEVHQISSLDKISKVEKSVQGPESLPEWIDTLGVDFSYQAPPERIIKPVACFYVQPRIFGQTPKDDLYRAIYIMQRTLTDLVNGIATKSNIEPSKVLRTIRINKQGINILFDDETVVELPEGQDMIAEFKDIRPESPVKREWDSGPTDIQVDGDLDVIHTVQSEGYELRLIF